MRQKADKLEKGKWYWDGTSQCSLLKFHSYDEDGNQLFSDSIYVRGGKYVKNEGEFILFTIDWDRYLPTQEDIEKYNLNEQE